MSAELRTVSVKLFIKGGRGGQKTKSINLYVAQRKYQGVIRLTNTLRGRILAHTGQTAESTGGRSQRSCRRRQSIGTARGGDHVTEREVAGFIKLQQAQNLNSSFMLEVRCHLSFNL